MRNFISKTISPTRRYIAICPRMEDGKVVGLFSIQFTLPEKAKRNDSVGAFYYYYGAISSLVQATIAYEDYVNVWIHLGNGVIHPGDGGKGYGKAEVFVDTNAGSSVPAEGQS